MVTSQVFILTSLCCYLLIFQEPYLLDDPLVVFYVDSSEDEQSARGSQASRGEIRGWGYLGQVGGGGGGGVENEGSSLQLKIT